MGLITEIEGAAEGYEPVTLPLAGEPPGPAGLDGAVLRRRSARPTKRAVIYLHCMDDPFVPDDLAGWYTDRGFHFYAADLRRLGEAGRAAQASRAGELAGYLACLDSAAAHVREADGVETVVLCGHGTGALMAALWCHARRHGPGADALVLAGPALRGESWLERILASPADRAPALLPAVRRRVRRGLDIACPVLVLCPASDWDAPGGTGGLPALPGGKAEIRLGPHVTWLRTGDAELGEVLPGEPGSPARKQVFDELGRWLSAYLSGQIRDQLL
jgi:pimeloyl-ACP methyl ester carboxylesterase